MWTWPTYGDPEINASWGFRALLWPFWAWGGVLGLFALRWILAVATFALAWATARRLGARGFTPLVVAVLGALAYRHRAQIRPEMLAGLLLITQIWLLESRRQGGPDRSRFVPLVALAWANVHLTYLFGLGVMGLYWLEAEWIAKRGRGRAASPGPLRIALAASIALSFVNPFGFEALAWPFRFALQWRSERMESDISELAPLIWSLVWRSGLPLLMAGWSLLALGRARARKLDAVEIGLCLFFTALALRYHRFLAMYAIVAVPFVSRDLAEWLARVRRAPRATPGRRAALAATVSAALCVPEGLNPALPLSLSLDLRVAPVHACDFIEQHGIGGRGMNHFAVGGYMAWRSWPSRDRLPFATIHTEYGTPEQRHLYHRAFFTPGDWQAFDRRYAIDYALLRYTTVGDDRLLDILDADTTWALVFVDDAAAVYVRRHGRHARIAESFAYRTLGGGSATIQRLSAAAAADSTYLKRLRAELERQARESPANSVPHTFLGFMALAGQRRAEARLHFEQALVAAPEKRGVRLGQALIALDEGRPRDALAWLAGERWLGADTPNLAFLTGRAQLALGNRAQARRWFRAELTRFPDNAEARTALMALEDLRR